MKEDPPAIAPVAVVSPATEAEAPESGDAPAVDATTDTVTPTTTTPATDIEAQPVEGTVDPSVDTRDVTLESGGSAGLLSGAAGAVMVELAALAALLL